MLSARAKLDRAKEHLKTLDAELERVLAEVSPYPVSVEHDPNTGWNNIYAEEVAFEPHALRIGLIVGDIIHNLRASLDHLAWDLAKLTTKKPSRQTQFPIFRGEIDYLCKSRPMIAQLGADHAAIVEELQPYKGDDPPETHPLVWLNHLSNIDKHQTVIVALAATQGIFVPIPPNTLVERVEMMHGILDGRTKIARLRLPDGKSHVDMEPALTPEIVFGGRGPVRGEAIRPAVDRIGLSVGDVLSRFAPAFPPNK